MKIRIVELVIWIILAISLLGLLFGSMILKDIRIEIVMSILVVGFSISLVFVRNSKSRMKIRSGRLKAYGEKVSYNSIVLINIGLGVLFLIIGFLSLDDNKAFILKITLGICWIIAGFANRRRYYIQITEDIINKLNLDFLKIRDIELITILSDKIELKTTKRTMYIFFAEIRTNEKQLLIDDFTKIKLKNNLA